MAKKHLAKRGIAALVIAVVLTMGTAAGTAFAYYTDTTQAKGMVSFSYNPNPPTTEVDEYPDPDTGQKTVAVKNTGEVDAMVRVNVFSPDFPDSWGVKVKVVAEGDAAEWTQDVTGVNASGDPVPNDEGWLYWPHPVAPGESTPAFTVEVTREDSTFSQPFDITVVQQCASAKSFVEGQPLLGTFADGEKRLMQIMPVKDGE